MTQQAINPSVDPVKLREQSSAPSTAANEVKLYSKDVGGVSELFVRKESDGTEIQLTSGGILNAALTAKVYTYSRPFSAGTGDLALTGLGKTAKFVIITGGANNQDHAYSAVPGFGTGSTAGNQVMNEIGTSAQWVGAATGKLIRLHTNAADGYDVTIKSMDSDGATLTFTQVGTPIIYTWSGTIILLG